MLVVVPDKPPMPPPSRPDNDELAGLQRFNDTVVDNGADLHFSEDGQPLIARFATGPLGPAVNGCGCSPRWCAPTPTRCGSC